MHDICMPRDARICACVALPPSGGLDALTFLFVVCAILAIVGCTRFGPADPEVDELVSEPRRGVAGKGKRVGLTHATAHTKGKHTLLINHTSAARNAAQ